jgi:hypothetical protein
MFSLLFWGKVKQLLTGRCDTLEAKKDKNYFWPGAMTK